MASRQVQKDEFKARQNEGFKTRTKRLIQGKAIDELKTSGKR